jgi:mannose-6-phosphate isomerase-like protein (cupin superfamily)
MTMLGDSFRRLQADELDADWDRLIRGEPTSDRDTLPGIAGKLDAMIPAATPGADARVHHKLFRDSEAALASVRNRPQSTALISAPLNLPGTASAKRWWSSPMAALEAVVACLIIAALALGISAYQSSDSQPSDRLFTAAEGTPAAPPTPDRDEFRAMQSAAQPTLTSWGWQPRSGKLKLGLSGAYLPAGTGYSGNYTGVTLISVLSGTVAITLDNGESIVLTKGETTSSYVATHFSVRNLSSETANIVNGFVYEQSLAASFTSDEPDKIDYYAYFIGNALIDAPSGPTTISLEVMDETSINRSVTSDATELFAAATGPITFVVTDGEVEIRGEITSSDDVSSGEGYDPITIGTTTILGGGNAVLIQPGASYDLSAARDSDVLAYGLSIKPSTATSIDPANPALPTDVAVNQTPSSPPPSGSQGGSITLNLYPAGAGYALQVSVLDITVAPASTWFGLGDWETQYESRVGVHVISGKLYTDDSTNPEPIAAGGNGFASSFIRNNDAEQPLVVRVVAIHRAGEPLPGSTNNTIIVPIASVPVERPEENTMRSIVMQSGTYMRPEGDHLDEMITLDEKFLAVESGTLLVQAQGSVSIQVTHGSDNLGSGESTELHEGESAELDSGDSVTFVGVDVAPRFTFVDNNPVSILTLSSALFPLQRAYVDTLPQSMQWEGPDADGTAGIILRELTFSPGSSLSYDFTGVTFYRVIEGTITVDSDEGPPVLLTAGETYVLTVEDRLGLTNTGNVNVVVIQAEVFAGSDFERAWGTGPSSGNVLRKRLGIAQVTLPVQPMNINFSWVDETNISNVYSVKGAALIANVGDGLNLTTVTDGVSMRNAYNVVPESIDPDRFNPIVGGSSGAFETGSLLLAEANSIFALAAPAGANILAYTVMISPISTPPAEGLPASQPPLASPTPG